MIQFNDILAVIALALSAYAVWTTTRFNKRQLSLIESQEALNARALEDSESQARNAAKANLGATLVKLGKGGYRLKIWNNGKAIARNVRLDIPDDDDLLIRRDVEEKFPLEALEPQGGVDLIASVHMQSKMKHKYVLRWEDDSSDDNEKTVYPTI